MFDNFITFEMLATFPIMVTVVSLLTQFTKKLIDQLMKNHTEYVVYLYSLLIVLFVNFNSNPTETVFVTVVMSIINALIVALASMKTFEKMVSIFH